MEEILTFTTPEGEEVQFEIIDQTRVAGVNYLLVARLEENEEGEAEAYILKDISAESDTQSNYVFIEDEAEQTAVEKIFQDELDSEVLLVD